ncbi:hypothetical protein V6E20_02395, partial [Serratia marcescens]|uniref:hypothetical protein n=1 Tax=Serratia marcescens TaxID=615 RepID=UPI002FD94F13
MSLLGSAKKGCYSLQQNVGVKTNKRRPEPLFCTITYLAINCTYIQRQECRKKKWGIKSPILL